MDQNFARFEALCTTLYGHDPNNNSQPKPQRQPTHDERQRADEELKVFTEDVQNLAALKSYMEQSRSKFVQYVAVSALKQIFTEHWSKIPVDEKLTIKDFLINFIVQKEAVLD